jgi:hypothetical protein
MKKALKPLIITVCALVILGGAYLIAEHVFPDTNPGATPTPVPTEAPWSGVLIEREIDTVARVMVTRPGEGAWTLALATGDGIGRTFEVVGRSEFRYNQAMLHSMVNRCFNLVAERLDVYTGPLSDFGFGPGQATVRLMFRDGSSTTILIGNATPDGRRRYIMLEDRDELYTVLESQVAPLLITETRIRDMSLISEGERSVEFLERYTVQGVGRPSVDIVLLTPEELAAATRAFPSHLRIIMPVTADMSLDRFQELILDEFEFGIFATEIAEDHPADLSVYGLDPANVTTVTLAMQRRPEVNLRIGFTREGRTYVMVGDEPSVLRVNEEQLRFLNRSYNEYATPFIWLYDIRDVKQIVYNFEGQRHVFSFNRVEGLSHFEYEGDINGIPVDDRSISQLFMRTLDIRAAQELPDNFRPGRPTLTIELTFHDDSIRRMTLYELNDRQFAVGVDGEYQFFAFVPDIDRLHEGIRLALAGEPIPRY